MFSAAPGTRSIKHCQHSKKRLPTEILEAVFFANTN
jgi:hypothetical protein